MSRFAREEIWKHNRHRGNAIAIAKNAKTIAAAATSTSEASRLAGEISTLATALAEALKTRNE